MQIANSTRHSLISAKARLADTPWARLVGLLNRATIDPDECLVITDCRSIHMFFMRFAIDVIFVDKNHKVVGLTKNIPPFGLSRYFFRAHYAIEGAVGMIERSKTEVGDQLAFIEQG